MTVEELIKRLEGFPKDVKVVTQSGLDFWLVKDVRLVYDFNADRKVLIS